MKNVREATWLDQFKLYDIDVKCFDYVWDTETWVDWIKDDDHVILVCEVDKVIAGFVACIILSDGVFIEKIAVKNPYRLQGVSVALLVRIHQLAHEQGWPNVLSITVPETFVIPGRPEDITGWLTKAALQIKTPFHSRYFEINGETIDGVPCTYEVPNGYPEDQ